MVDGEIPLLGLRGIPICHDLVLVHAERQRLWLWIGIGQFLAGWIAPLALFPAWFRQFASWLPFRSTLGFPVEILTGQLSWPEIRFGFLVTLGWILLFLAIYRLLWRMGLRRYEAVGA